MHMTGREALPKISFHLFRIVTVVALALSIAGITSNMSADGLKHPDIKIKIGMILYVVSFVQMIFYLAILAMRRNSVEKGEHRVLLAVALSSPFILVRLLYVFFVWFLHNSTFSMMDGNVTVQLVMSVLEEFAVVIICLAVGLTLRVRGRDSGRSEESVLSDYGAHYVKP